jgi:arylsulfatase A-like enzyme
MAQRNLILFGVDSLWADHMNSYGYPKLTMPHIDKLASQGVLFERNYCPHVPTTSAYASMLTGMDCFSTQVVALRHKGGLTEDVRTLPEMLRDGGYDTTCVGFSGNPSSRGFDTYLDYKAWGSWEENPLRKAEGLNDVAIPELERMAEGDKPFFLFLRHMDPHSPYLPPAPFNNMFYTGDAFDKANKSLDPVFKFKPFKNFFSSWMPPGVTDAEYIIALYDGALAYMDACIQQILNRIDELGLADDTLVVFNGDHGETLMDHECYFDHHGTYDCTLHVPLVMRLPGRLPAGKRVPGYTTHQDLVPTIMELLGVRPKIKFDGRSLMPLINGKRDHNATEFYITEATWMRKHGWRTPEWKMIVALEPDFHFKPEVELYNLVTDPGENNNVAEKEPEVVRMLKARMEAWIAKREREVGKTNPMFTNLNWHGTDWDGPFPDSQTAYDTVGIGSVAKARTLQARDAKKGSKKARKAKKPKGKSRK